MHPWSWMQTCACLARAPSIRQLHPPLAAGGGAMRMCPRGGELRSAAAPGVALIAAANASAAVPCSVCPVGSGVGCAAAVHVLHQCAAFHACGVLAVMLCLSTCAVSSLTVCHVNLWQVVRLWRCHGSVVL